MLKNIFSEEISIFSKLDLYFADFILKNFSVPLQDERRIALAFLCYQTRQGHLCVSIKKKRVFPGREFSEEFLKYVKNALENLPPFMIDHTGDDHDKPLVKFQNNYYLHKNWVIEGKIISQMQRLSSAHSAFDFSFLKERCLSLLEEKVLTEDQFHFFEKFMKHSLIFLSGGPGSGKTYCAANLLKLINEIPRLEIVVTAPTGKAVSHLEQKVISHNTSFFQAKTLHALLRTRPYKELCFNQIFLSADVIIVDEASMIDAQLMALFLSSIKSGAKVVFIGDIAQLPPVEGGSVFADLVVARKDQCVFLKKCHRFKNEKLSQYIQEADGKGFINKILTENIYHEWDFTEPEKCIEEKIVPLVEKHLFLTDISPSEAIEQFEKFRILSCMRQGRFGVDFLNRYLHQYFLKKFKKKRYVYPILIAENHYQMKLFNGMTGSIIKEDHEEKAYFYVENTLKVFPKLSLPKYEVAFVISVHKSQGSEYDHLFTIIPPGSEKFGREILYTAITRAKKTIDITGPLSTIGATIQKDGRKNSQITNRLS